MSKSKIKIGEREFVLPFRAAGQSIIDANETWVCDIERILGEIGPERYKALPRYIAAALTNFSEDLIRIGGPDKVSVEVNFVRET